MGGRGGVLAFIPEEAAEKGEGRPAQKWVLETGGDGEAFIQDGAGRDVLALPQGELRVADEREGAVSEVGVRLFGGTTGWGEREQLAEPASAFGEVATHAPETPQRGG